MSRRESHRSYSASFKLKVIETANEKGKHFAAKFYDVDRKRVREWCKDADKLKFMNASRKRYYDAGRPLKYMDIEDSLLKWFEQRREAGVRVTGKALK